MNPYDIFKEFMDVYDMYPKPIPGFQNRYINRLGMVYDQNGNQIQPYKYNDNSHYHALYVRDYNNNPHVIGIHQAVAMTFLNGYYPGCIVHHKDENKYHNWDSNLEIISRSDHGRHHHPFKYQPIWQTCQVCGNRFLWTPEEQYRYYSDIKRGKNRIITCSRPCAAYYGRMVQLGRV